MREREVELKVRLVGGFVKTITLTYQYDRWREEEGLINLILKLNNPLNPNHIEPRIEYIMRIQTIGDAPVFKKGEG